MTQITGRASVTLDKQGNPVLHRSVVAGIKVTGETGQILPGQAVLTQVIEGGENLVTPDIQSRKGDPRRRLESLVRGFSHRNLREFAPSASAAVSRLPSKADRIAGWGEFFRARNAAMDIPPRVMEESVEVVPGMTFRWTKTEKTPGATKLEFEVRIRRFHAGDGKGEPGLEPVFVGVHLEDENKESLLRAFPYQRVEAAAEYVLVGRSMHVPDKVWSQAKAWSVRACHRLERVRVEFETGTVEVVKE